MRHYLKMNKKKALVVGAGFAGAVVARELADSGQWEVIVVDKRGHVGGNAYDYINDLGIRVHEYGPHLWHGNSDAAQEWASRFTEWVPYKHYVHARLPDGRNVPLPINADTIEAVFGEEFTKFANSNPAYLDYTDDSMMFVNGYSPLAYESFIKSKCVEIDPSQVTNSREHVESSVGKELCELLFAPYTKKMWDMDLSDLPASVAARIPTKTDNDPYYFPKDKHQCLPKDGYTAMFQKIFDHKNIITLLGVSREGISESNQTKFDVIFTSEPIDTYYKCDLGELPWRSIKCHVHDVPIPQALSAPVVNFTHDGPFTRVTEWKQLPAHGGNPYWTTLTFEEPCDYRDNGMERYYPVKTSHAVDPNRELYKRYRERAKADGIHFIGRCGRYVYLDMQPCVNSTLAQVRKFLAGDTIPLDE
jgi:UDP-galactopyranose mutase